MATVSMFGPDGQVHDVQPGDVQAALANHGELAHAIINPKDGQTHWVRHSQLGDAIRAGGMPEGAMVPRRPMNSSPSLGEQIDSGLQDAGNKFLGMVKPGGMSPLSQFYSQVGAGARAVQGVASQPSAISKAGAALAPLVGVDAQSVQQAAQTAGKTGNYGPLVSNAVVPPFLASALSRATGVRDMGPQVDAAPAINELAAGEVQPKAPISDAVAAQRITDAVNPAPRQMARFQANVEKQMPNIREFVGGDKPKSPSDLLSAVTQASETKRANYYQNIIQPNADVNLPAPSLFKGQTTQPGSTTIGMLDKRLSDINAQLSGSYDKEGVSQVQALSGPEKMALMAESAQVRDLMNQELGVRTGLGKDAVAKARSDFGQLRDIQMKLQTAISRQRYMQNQMNQKPLSPEDVTAAGLARQAFKATTRKVLGTPQERAIKSSF